MRTAAAFVLAGFYEVLSRRFQHEADEHVRATLAFAIGATTPIAATELELLIDASLHDESELVRAVALMVRLRRAGPRDRAALESAILPFRDRPDLSYVPHLPWTVDASGVSWTGGNRLAANIAAISTLPQPYPRVH